MDSFAFDNRVQRYRYTSGDRDGQFVALDSIHALAAEYQQQQREQSQEILQRLFDGDINTAEWLEETAQHLRQSHINAYALGYGGHEGMESGEFGSVGARLRTEYRFLRNFAVDIQSGTLSEAQIKARLNQYYSSLWQTYERARERSHGQNQFVWERRVIRSSNPCADCIRYAGRGWVTIGTLPPPGTRSICKMEDKCRKEFSNLADRPENASFIFHGWGWLA